MDNESGPTIVSRDNLSTKAFDPDCEDILYMDMSGGSKSSRNSWTSQNVDLYMNSPKLTPRSSLLPDLVGRTIRNRGSNRLRVAAARELWKSETELHLNPREMCNELARKSTVTDCADKAASDSELLSVCDIFFGVPIQLKRPDMEDSLRLTESSENMINEKLNKLRPKPLDLTSTNADSERLSKVLEVASPKCIGCFSPLSDGTNSPIYLSPQCQSCLKRLDLPTQDTKSNENECDMDATYMSISGIQELDPTSTIEPPALPKRNPETLLKSEKITQKMCRCRDMKIQTKRSVHLEDTIEGEASRVYTVKDIVDSVDELIGAFCEDTSLSAFATESRKSFGHNLLRKPSLKLGDNHFFKRPKSISFRRSGDKNTSKDSGFESDDHKNKSYGNVNKAERCNLIDCSNCQEFDGISNKEQDGATLDCYSFAQSKRLPVEAYIPQNNKKNTCPHSDSVRLPLNKSPVRRSKSLFEHIPNVTSVVGPKLTEISDSHLYRSFVNKASKIKNKAPFALAKYGIKSQKFSEPTVKSSEQNNRKITNDMNNNRRGNDYVDVRTENGSCRPASIKRFNGQPTVCSGLKETAC